jgi:DNA-directed RNA polymerase beta' subunit
MNLHMPQNELSESELRNLAAIPYQIISPSSNAPIIGIYQDSMLGSYQFTRPDVEFTPRQAMNLLMGYNNVDMKELRSKKRISSFDILSQITPPISLKYKTKLFEDNEDASISNNVLEITNGKYLRGQADKGVFGSGTKGVLNRICNDFGNMACSNYIDDLQQVITEYMKTSSYSVGISDLISDRKTTEKVLHVISTKMNEVKDIIDKVHLGILENNSGKTNTQEFEVQVGNVLNNATSETGKIGVKSLDASNRFVKIVKSGSKGSMLNISQMISCLGQQSIDGKRVPYGFDNRTLPHFSKYDDSPESRGFVKNSYISGLTAPELFFHAMGGRMGLIDTAVKSVIWETPIVLIDENGKPIYTEIGRWIDGKIDTNVDAVQHFDEKNMELLNVKNIYVPTTCENGKVSWEEITAVTRHDPGTKLYEIKTLGGRTVTVTESKSLLIWNKERKGFYEMLTPEICVGDCVPVTAELCEPPTVLNQIYLTDYLSKTEFVFGDTFDLDYENGVFIGLFLAEGNVNRNSISITNNNEGIRNFVKSWFDKHHIHWTELQKTNHIGGLTTTVRGASSILSQFINKLVGHGASNKYVHTEAFVANTEYICGLLSGYFSGDGTVSKNSVEACSSSKRLIEGVSMLCSRIGVFCKVFQTQMKKNNLGTVNIKPSYRISIRSQWGKIFAEKVKLFDDKKQCKLVAIQWNTSHRNFATHNNVVLDPIVEIVPIGVENHPKMYDLTIPTTLNFGLANGLQVRDTSTTGYIQRRLVKGLEDLKVEYDGTVRNNMGKIVQFTYGDDGAETTRVENQNIPLVNMSIEDIYMYYDLVGINDGENKDLLQVYTSDTIKRFRKQRENTKQMCMERIKTMIEYRDELVDKVFKFKNEDAVKTPIAFQHIIQNIQGQLNLTANSAVDITPQEFIEICDATFAKLKRMFNVTHLFEIMFYFNMSPKEVLIKKRFNQQAVSILMEQIVLNYKKSIVHPGEMVGVIAGQSIGEPTTQLTLNSFVYETEILVKNSAGEIKCVQIGDFTKWGIASSRKLDYMEDKDTTYAELSEYYEVPTATEYGETVWRRIEAVTKHPVINEDGTNTMLKVTTKGCRELIATKAKSFLKLVDGKIIGIEGKDLKVGDYLPVSKKALVYAKNNLDYSFGYNTGISYTENKSISNQIIFSNQNCVLGFIDAYVDKNAIVYDDRIEIPSSSHKLLTSIQLMLKNLGVISQMNQDSMDRYILTVCNGQSIKLAKMLNLPVQSKRDRIAKLLEQTFKHDYCKSDLKIPNEVNGEIVMELRDGRCPDLEFDKIISIEEVSNTTEYAYDLTVEDTRNFDCMNGLCVRDTFHLSGVATKSNVTRGVPRIEEILRLTRNPDKPSATVFLKPVDQYDKDKATNYCNMIEHTKLVNVVKSVEICFDPDDTDTKMKQDEALIQQFYEFEKMVGDCNGEAEPEAEVQKSKWIIRIEIDAELLLEKNITMDDINFAVKHSHGSEIDCIFSDMNSSNLVFRIRLNESVFKKKKGVAKPLDQSDAIYLLKNFQDNLLNNIVLRGVNGITNVNPRQLKNVVVKEDSKYVQKDTWILDTTGSNLIDLFALDFIDYTRTYSNDIREMYDCLGIEAARQNILNEFNEVMEASDAYVNYHHLSILCDRMTVKAELVPMFRSGIMNDDIGPISKGTYEMHTEMFLDASRHGDFDQMRGVSANVMCGQPGYYGTNSFSLLLDLKAMDNIADVEVAEDANLNKHFEKFEKENVKCDVKKIQIENNVTNIKVHDVGACDDDYQLF